MWHACLLIATMNRLWHAVPLVVVISLVYAASRNETRPQILSHALRLGLYICAFLAAVFVVLMFVQSRL